MPEMHPLTGQPLWDYVPPPTFRTLFPELVTIAMTKGDMWAQPGPTPMRADAVRDYGPSYAPQPAGEPFEDVKVRCKRAREAEIERLFELQDTRPHAPLKQLVFDARREGHTLLSLGEAEKLLLDRRVATEKGRLLTGRASMLDALGLCLGEGLPIRLSASDADDDAEPVWIQLAKPGTFKGHPSGKPFTLNRSVFEQIVTNFRGNKDGRLPIDFEHASEQASSEGTIPQGGAPAQGWIVDMKIGDDGNLYAKVEWGTLARQYIREGQYRFISPAIHLRMKDRETGQDIGAYVSSAGLTNQPFLDGMRPLAARRDGGGVAPEVLSHTALTARLMREGTTYRDAQDEAARLLRAEVGR